MMKMVNNVLIRTKRLLFDSRNSLIWVVIASFFIAGLMVLIFPSVSEMGEEMEVLIENYPPELMEIFGIQDLNFSIFEVFISAEYYSMFWAMVFIPFLVAWTTQFAKEAENGTLGLLLSYPISRKEAVTANLLDTLVKGLIASTLMIWGVVLLTVFEDVDLIYENWFKMWIMVTTLFWALGSLGVMLSVLVRNRMKVIGILSAFIVGGYFLNIVAKLYEDLEFIKYLSIFHYYGEPVEILYRGELNANSLLIFLGIAILSSIVAVYSVDKVDLPKG